MFSRKQRQTIGLDLISSNQQQAAAVAPPREAGRTALTGAALSYLEALQQKTKAQKPKKLTETAKTAKSELTRRNLVEEPAEPTDPSFKSFANKEKKKSSVSSFSQEKSMSFDGIPEEPSAPDESVASSVSTGPLAQVHSFSSLTSIESEKPNISEPGKSQHSPDVQVEGTIKQESSEPETPKTDDDVPSAEPYASDFEEEGSEEEDITSEISEIPEEPQSPASSSSEHEQRGSCLAKTSVDSGSSSTTSISAEVKLVNQEAQTDDTIPGRFRNRLPSYSGIPSSFTSSFYLHNYSEMFPLDNHRVRVLMLDFLMSQLDFLRSQANLQYEMYANHNSLLDQWGSSASRTKITSESVLQKMKNS